MRTTASAGKIRQSYEFIKANRNRFDVRTMCQHEPSRKLLGQRGCGIIFQQPQKRTHQEEDLQNSRACTGRDI